MGRLTSLLVFVALLVAVFAHSHSHEAPHLKYGREINEAAARGEDTVSGHGHSHEHGHSHDHDDHHDHDHDHEHHEHAHHHDDHHDDHQHHHDEHAHSHGHDEHGHAHEHHGHAHEHKKPVDVDYKFSETGPLAFLNDPQKRFWTFSIGSTVLISLFPCFILTFIPINSNEDENSSNKLKVLLALGAGGLLGDAFLHLIPHAQMAHGDGHGHTHSHSHASGEPHEPHDLSVGGWVLGGFFIFFVVEKFVRIVRGEGGHGHSHGPRKDSGEKKAQHDKKPASKKDKTSDTEHSEEDDKKHHEQHRAAVEAARLQIAAYLNLIADFMHNFTDGLAIGASFVAGEKVGIITMITVLIHEIPHEIGDFAILVQSGYSKRKAMLIQLLTAIGALAGCFIACASSDPFSLAEQAQSSWVLPFTAGGFIYIAAVSVIPELLEKSSFLLSIAEVLAMTLGVFAMYLIALYE
ncbi:unnamed protein product [Bursaphelenchus okinawaensis]|uniref:Uncharacterized protein n=1 Tax=Bursaphelenchus okinawaensis TaxID=465554 RepID=A0A811LMD8_9BILA|nr:unnamed protein product [Bursaphelenchus okinawaensis]CAG9128009.1 unnamed protein product [Bursaphelenchus okinawaensis]